MDFPEKEDMDGNKSQQIGPWKTNLEMRVALLSKASDAVARLRSFGESKNPHIHVLFTDNFEYQLL